MRKISQPEALPAHCFLCRSGNRDWYIDPGFSEDWYGAVIICSTCVDNMARLAGFWPPDAVEKAQNNLLLLGDALEREIQVNAGLRTVLNGMDILSSVPASMVLDSGQLSLSLTMDEQPAQGTEDQLGVGAGETSESSDDEGMAELHSDDESDGEYTISL